ncbi:preprotein translocase subunit SecG [Patescibacteria group bacterium]|nr:preprotein translocase subunit SecG [Patescibacteria group bacterium]
MSAISIAQIIVSILLIITILLQERSSGLSGVFGGDSEFYHTRRGLEKIIFWSTIVFAITFGVLSLISGLS